MSTTVSVRTTSKRIVPKTTGTTALWRHRRTLRVLVQRDLAVKYQKTVMGYLWSLIEPLSMALIYWMIFGVLFDRGDVDGVSFALYVVSGIFAWMWASHAMSESTSSLTSQSSLITTMKVPREVFPVARVFARLAEFLAGIPIIVLFALLFGGKAVWGWNLALLPVAILLQAVLLTGIAFILASLNVLYRDVQRVMRLATRILFYAAPTVYPFHKVVESDMPHWVKVAYEANPFVGIIRLQHGVWIPGEIPGWRALAYCATVSVVLLFFGRWLFVRLERRVLKQL